MTDRPKTPAYAFLFGAQKSGTTSLAVLLDQHPDLCLSDPKEPDFFGGNYDKGWDWYEARFAKPSCRLRLDASQVYTLASDDDLRLAGEGPDIPARIHEHCPEALFIYVVRNRADRAYSAYWHNVREGREPYPFRESNERDRDEYITPSLYCRQLDHYFRFFPRDRFLVISFDELKEDQMAVVRRCVSFLGLEAFDGFASIEPKNQSFQYTAFGQLVRNLAGSRQNMKRLTSFAKALVPASLWARMKGLAASDTPRLSDEERAWIDQFFEEDKARFKDEFGIDV